MTHLLTLHGGGGFRFVGGNAVDARAVASPRPDGFPVVLAVGLLGAETEGTCLVRLSFERSTRSYYLDVEVRGAKVQVVTN